MWIGRAARLAVAGLGAVAAVWLLLEVGFRVAALFVAAAPDAVPPGSRVVLCVGDSHTRGQPPPDNYPAELERLLNERGAGAWRVLNVGVPGTSTRQVRERFERYLDYYRPAVVLHWAGINNAWNHPDTPWRRRPLLRLAEYSKVIRFVRVALFYRGDRHHVLERDGIELKDLNGVYGLFRVRFAGIEEDIHTNFGDQLPVADVERTTRTDVEAMMRTAWGRGIPMYLVTYPFGDGSHRGAVNRAIESVSAEFHVPWVDSSAAVAALRATTPDAQLLDAWAHPTPPLYRRIAAEAHQVLERQGVVAAAPAATPPSPAR
jgi:lysophospholipase L1-like esterase